MDPTSEAFLDFYSSCLCSMATFTSGEGQVQSFWRRRIMDYSTFLSTGSLPQYGDCWETGFAFAFLAFSTINASSSLQVSLLTQRMCALLDTIFWNCESDFKSACLLRFGALFACLEASGEIIPCISIQKLFGFVVDFSVDHPDFVFTMSKEEFLWEWLWSEHSQSLDLVLQDLLLVISRCDGPFSLHIFDKLSAEAIKQGYQVLDCFSR
eukprot:TRINITY_DN19557_c0_g3_i1.p2 TRINITY_DN19557_c0_g3~~TRINITY_DN19557_c0_g3_i1.p2  ORF type:complete len:227 (-),score=45.63 TRINITY_DN19557_c0_g3_i1:625-1254(-)